MLTSPLELSASNGRVGGKSHAPACLQTPLPCLPDKPPGGYSTLPKHELNWLAAALVLVAVFALCPRVAAQGGRTDDPISNSWNPVGPLGGTINAFVVSPSNPGIAYVAAAGGVFRSSNNGGFWFAASNGLPGLPVNALAVSAGNPDVVFAAINDASLGGVFKTTDGGVTWNPVNNGKGALTVTALAVNAANQNIVYAGTLGGGVYKSTTGGASWDNVNNGLGGNLQIVALAISRSSPGTLYAGTQNNRVFRTTNDAASWEDHTPPGSFPQLTGVTVDPNNAAVVFAHFGASFVSGSATYRSSDGGGNWSAFLLNAFPIASAGPGNSSVIYAKIFTISGTFLYRTSNGGSSWIVLGTDFLDSTFNYQTMAVSPSDSNVFFAGLNARGLFRTLDGGAVGRPSTAAFWATTADLAGCALAQAGQCQSERRDAEEDRRGE
jgi:photosystem II stability/assembly factor-like uncharacterized protein